MPQRAAPPHRRATVLAQKEGCREKEVRLSPHVSPTLGGRVLCALCFLRVRVANCAYPKCTPNVECTPPSRMVLAFTTLFSRRMKVKSWHVPRGTPGQQPHTTPAAARERYVSNVGNNLIFSLEPFSFTRNPLPRPPGPHTRAERQRPSKLLTRHSARLTIHTQLIATQTRATRHTAHRTHTNCDLSLSPVGRKAHAKERRKALA